MKEVWKPIKDYEMSYEVSNLGRVKRKAQYQSGRFFKEKFITITLNSNTGYQFACLRKDKHDKNYSVHRLVAQAFIQNPHNYSDVNHIDGNKLNNRVENLEWCTRSQNLKHAVEIGLVESQCKIRRKVIVKIDDQSISFDSMKDCASYFGFQKSWVLNRIRKHGNPFNYNNFQIYVCGRNDAPC